MKSYQVEIDRHAYIVPEALEALKDVGPVIQPVRAYIETFRSYHAAIEASTEGTQRSNKVEAARLVSIAKGVAKGKPAELIWQEIGQSLIPMPNAFATDVAEACRLAMKQAQQVLMQTIVTHRDDILMVLERRQHHDMDIAIQVVKNKR